MRPGIDRGAPIFLVGFMGAGKTCVGRLLAQRLGVDFADTDASVEASAGRSIEAIFRESGEGRFREMEWDALMAAARRTRAVVATGGGLFLGVAQRSIVRAHGASVWLDAPLPTIEARLGEATTRPLWMGADPIERRMMFERRRAAYALADGAVDSGRGDPETVARRVETSWRSLFR